MILVQSQNVSENEIGFSGGCAISVALREKPNIRRLNLSGRPSTKEMYPN